MCLVVLAFRHHPDYPLVVVANLGLGLVYGSAQPIRVETHLDVKTGVSTLATSVIGGYGVGITHIELERQQCVAEFGRERVQPVLAARGGDDAMASLDEAAGDGGTKAGGSAGNEDDHERVS